MENQHKLIKGYRELTEGEIALMNQFKQLAEQVGVAIEAMEGVEGIDQRWVAIAKTDLQKGFMAIIRSVAQPTTF